VLSRRKQSSLQDRAFIVFFGAALFICILLLSEKNNASQFIRVKKEVFSLFVIRFLVRLRVC